MMHKYIVALLPLNGQHLGYMPMGGGLVGTQARTRTSTPAGEDGVWGPGGDSWRVAHYVATFENTSR